MNCPVCGELNEEGYRFCRACGGSLPGVEDIGSHFGVFECSDRSGSGSARTNLSTFPSRLQADCNFGTTLRSNLHYWP